MLDARERIIETYDFPCEDDPAAEEVARRLMADMRQARSVEIWVRPRLVTRVGGPRSGAAPSEEPDAEPSPKSGRR